MQKRPHKLRDLGTLAELLLIARQGMGVAGEAAVHRELPAVQMERQLQREDSLHRTGAVRQGL